MYALLFENALNESPHQNGPVYATVASEQTIPISHACLNLFLQRLLASLRDTMTKVGRTTEASVGDGLG